MKIDLQVAIDQPTWQQHKIGDCYTMDGRPDKWKIAYYPLFGTWDNAVNKQKETTEERWVDFEDPRALIEKPLFGKLGEKIGTDFRQVPLMYLTKII